MKALKVLRKVLRIFVCCVLLLFGVFCLYVSCSGFVQAASIKAETGQLYWGCMALIALCFLLGLTALFVGIKILSDFYFTEMAIKVINFLDMLIVENFFKHFPKRFGL